MTSMHIYMFKGIYGKYAHICYASLATGDKTFVVVPVNPHIRQIPPPTHPTPPHPISPHPSS